MSDIVAITSIAAGGDGVGRLGDGRAVFVPRTAPGERVRLRDGIKLLKNFARGELAEVVEPAGGGARVTPPCPHYPQDRCGGCQLQHVAYDAQLQAKRAIVGDALRRIAKLDVPDPEIVEAVEEWRYRAKVSMAVKGGGGRGKAVGFHPYDRPGTVFPLIDCHIADFRLMTLWRELKPRLDLLPVKLARLTLRLDREGRRHVIAESAGEPWAARDATPHCSIVRPGTPIARVDELGRAISACPRPFHMEGRPRARDRLRRLRASGGAFFAALATIEIGDLGSVTQAKERRRAGFPDHGEKFPDRSI